MQPTNRSPADRRDEPGAALEENPGNVHECRTAGGPSWVLFALAADFGLLALVSAVIWAAVRADARPPELRRRAGRPVRRGHRTRELLRRTAGLVVSVLLLGHWLLGLAHVGRGSSPRLAVIGGSGLAVLLPVLAMTRLGAVARRQQPTAAAPLPWSAVSSPIRWALPALAVVGTAGAAVVLVVRLGGSC